MFSEQRKLSCLQVIRNSQHELCHGWGLRSNESHFAVSEFETCLVSSSL